MATKTRFNFTKARLEELPNAAAGMRDTYHDTRQPSLAVRVTELGKKTFRVRGRPRGTLKVETLTIGPFPAIAIEQARAAAAEQLARWARAESIVVKKQAAREADEERQRSGITLGDALRDYVEKKRRGKDGKPLKARTRDDYLQMLRPVHAGGDGRRKSRAGELAHLDQRPIGAITGDDIRQTHATLTEERGVTRAAYAMRVLRAVLNWQGVKVEGNPLSKEVPGKDRLQLPMSQGNPNPIPVELLGKWWAAACTPPAGAETDPAGDYLRFLLLSGCRSIEVKGGHRGEVVFGDGIRVADVDMASKRVRLNDTKNRSDHQILLSTQAAEIMQRCIKGKTPAAPVFEPGDFRARLAEINTAAGVEVSPHDLRATFASIAEELVSVYALKRMLNHASGGDVTGGHYVAKSETQLRAGWQVVADFIEELAASKKAEDASQVAA